MSRFRFFREKIKSISAGFWKDNDIYFTQIRDGYYADYRPKYPECSLHDALVFWNGRDTLQLAARDRDGTVALKNFLDFDRMKTYIRDSK